MKKPALRVERKVVVVVVVAEAAVTSNGKVVVAAAAACFGAAFVSRDQTFASWCSILPNLRLNDRRWGLALVVQRSGKAFSFCRRALPLYASKETHRKYRNNSVIQRM